MSETKEKKKKGINPLMIVIILLVLVIVGLASYFLFLKKAPASTAYIPTPVVEASWSAGDFLVNLVDTDTERYLKTTIYLTYDSTDKTLGTDLETDKSGIRDAIISVIRSKKSSDVSTNNGTDVLKADIIKRVNAFLGGNKIIHVYYNDLIIE